MKLPKVPKNVPKKLPSKASPLNPKPFRAQPPPAPKPAQQAPVKPAPPKALPYRTPEPLQTPRPTAEPTFEEIKEIQHRQKVAGWRRTPVIVCSVLAFGIGLYGVQLFISLNKDAPEQEVPEDLIDRFDKEATGYDEKVNMAEILLRLNARRKALTEKAHGHVLEVAVGTGRNISYYPTKKCSTVTLLDASAPMLAVAKRKWKDEQPEYFHRVFFKHQSALDPITPPYGAQDGYDTVIATMSLCSTPEPVKLLRNIEAATKEDDGQILLLEHGKSHYEWLNKLLDKTAPAHAYEHGCWWNKDIGKIVEESGLEVVEIKRYNFGTTWWVELKPRKGMRTRLLADVKQAVVGAEAAAAPDQPVAQKPWWNLWR